MTPSEIKRPASQFYWADWLSDLAVRACSCEARGLWIDMLCLMHQGEPYGHLRTDGIDINLEELARISGISKTRCRTLIAELEKRKVFSKNEEGTIFSRRMIRDEQVRNARASGGIKSINHPNTCKPKGQEEGYPSGDPSTPHGTVPIDPPPSSSSSSLVVKKESKPKKERVLRVFVEPAPEEVAAFFRSIGSNGETARRFYDYEVATGWMVGSKPMKNWQAGARDWLSRPYNQSSNGHVKPEPIKFIPGMNGE